MDRDKLIEATRLAIARVLDFKTDKRELELLADHLIANGIGDITEWKHRADVAEEALRELIAEMYANGIRPICNQEMLYETRLEQAEERLKEIKCIKN